MRPAFICGALAAALALSLPRTARADDSVLEREAQARFEEGVARVKAGNIEGARVSFAQAYTVLHKPTILWNLALAEEKTGHLVEALGHFKELARGAQDGGDDRGNAEKHVGALMAQTGHLDVSAPAGTPLFVDSAAAAVAPFADPLDVSVGRHHLHAQTIQGPQDTTVDVAAGQIVHVNLMPPREAVRPPAPPAIAQEGNSASSAATPGENREERSGPSATRAVTVVSVATAAAVSLAFGAYFMIQSLSDENTAQGFRQQYPKNYCFQMTNSVCAQWNDAVQAQGRDATVSDVFWVAGGVLAAGAAVLWFVWPKDSTGSGAHAAGARRGPPAALRLTPSVGPAGAGLTATGRF
jgi:hypothetical protein